MTLSASVLLVILLIAPACARPDERAPACALQDVAAHVLQQFEHYGPLSTDREYFGYIYRHRGAIASAVSQGSRCQWTQDCEIDTRAAANLIPARAKVLGEWHTHPHKSGALTLSGADVRGAHDNRHIACYRAFFGAANGEIFAWDIEVSSVSAAMKTLRRLGSYRREPD